MRQKRWTEDEETYLDYFLYDPDADFKAVADFLGRSKKSVAMKADKMRRSEKNKRYLKNHRVWSEKEIGFLEINYTVMKCKEIGEALNRSEYSVQKKAWKLGLTKLYKPFAKKEEILSLNKLGLDSKKIGEIVGLPHTVVRQFCNRQNIKVVPVSKKESQKTWRDSETARVRVKG